MDNRHQSETSSSSNQPSSPDADHSRANCSERSYLAILVAELLLENQKLRFDLWSVHEHCRLASSIPNAADH